MSIQFKFKPGDIIQHTNFVTNLPSLIGDKIVIELYTNYTIRKQGYKLYNISTKDYNFLDLVYVNCSYKKIGELNQNTIASLF